MKKKIFITLFFILILVANLSFASYSTVTMEVVEEPVCTIDFGENSHFEKKLISKNLNNKEVTLQLQVVNDEKAIKPTGEIMLVLDNSRSMLDPAEGTETAREELVINSAKTLVSKLLEDNTQLKIGVVSFSTNTDSAKEGTIEDAQFVSDLTNDVNSLTTAISSIEYTGPRTDLESGITLAKQYFTEEDNNKYMIVLTDGVPNVAINYTGGYFSDDVITKTNTALKSVQEDNISALPF